MRLPRNEAEFGRALRDAIPSEPYRRLVWQRYTDRLTSGIVDVEAAWGGMTTWLELKWLPEPPRATDLRRLIGRPFVTQLQRRFLLARSAAGLRAYAVFGWAEAGAVRFAAIHPVMLDALTVRELAAGAEPLGRVTRLLGPAPLSVAPMAAPR